MATWRQALLRAEVAGDPLATWVLRFCGSAVALDRSGLASSCSPAPEAQARARQQLLALDLGPSFRLAVLGRVFNPPTPTDVCGAAAGQPAPVDVTNLHRAQMLRHVGHYRGAAFGCSQQPVLTWLVPSSTGVWGGDAFIRQPHGALQLNLGRLGPCLAGEAQELVCVWHDRHGTGLVSMLFNADSTAFRAVWRPVDGSSSEFLRMDPRHWDGPTA